MSGFSVEQVQHMRQQIGHCLIERLAALHGARAERAPALPRNIALLALAPRPDGGRPGAGRAQDGGSGGRDRGAEDNRKD